MKNIRIVCLVATSAASLCSMGVALAQQSAPPVDDAAAQSAPQGDVAEILVTASRLRDENVQDTPIAVSVLSGDTVEALNSADIRSLSAVVPNLVTNSNGSIPGQALISIRGFNTVSGDISVEPGIVTYLDGIYQPLTWGNLSDLYDVERLEVLRGPQGTLLGKNVAAGAIMITRTRPTGEFGGKFQAEYGSENLFELNGLLNFPIVDGKLAGKIFASYRTRDDYVPNLDIPGGDTGGQKHFSVRGAIVANPTDNFEWYLTADYTKNRPSAVGARNLSRPTSVECVTYNICAPDAGRRNVTHIEYRPDNKIDRESVTSKADWSIAGVTMTSLTGYQHYQSHTSNDLDATSLDLLRSFNVRVRLESISQEVRIASDEGEGLDLDGKLSWLLGAYINHSNATNSQGTFSLGRTLFAHQNVIRDSKALFAFLDYQLLEDVRASFGVRRSWDEVAHRFASNTLGTTVPAFTNRETAKFTNTSFEGGLEYKFSPDKMIYVRYAEGYRGGGFVGLPPSPAAARQFQPETSVSYEAGLKTEWWDGRFLFNVTAFRVKYDDLQRTAVVVGPNNTVVQTTDNAAAATTRGIEIETMLKPVDGLTLRANGGYLDAKYTRYASLSPGGAVLDLSSTPFAYSPKYTLGLSGEYRAELSGDALPIDAVTFRTSYNYLSKHIASNTVSTLAARQSGYGLLDASINFESDRGYQLTLYVKNATNKGYTTFAVDVGGVTTIAYDGLPRTWGASIGFRF